MTNIRPKPEHVDLPDGKVWEELSSYQRYYYENKEDEKERTAKRKEYLVEWFQEYKDDLSCPRCGESRNPALDFHHRDSNEKEMRVSQMPRNGYGQEAILKEIDKCDVICANCHRVEHSNRKI